MAWAAPELEAAYSFAVWLADRGVDLAGADEDLLAELFNEYQHSHREQDAA